MEQFIYECAIEFLTLERAERLVPPEFKWAYAWFQEREGTNIPHLPMAPYAPAKAPLKLASQSGIHSPNYLELPSRGAGSKKYALTIHARHNGPYADLPPFVTDDGTWLFEYCAHAIRFGDSGKKDFNGYLMNNMEDGIPVAVLIQNKDGSYKVMGLAFVESFNSETATFHLHGPVNEATEQEGMFSAVDREELSEEERQLLNEWDFEDNRIRVVSTQVRREGQAQFRQELLRAYDNQCALTEVNVLEALQAAHIYPYRGSCSQVVSNGLLLRADIHQLFDAHKLSIEPGNYKLRLGEQLKASSYRKYDAVEINTPTENSLKPNNKLLELHFREFCSREQDLSA